MKKRLDKWEKCGIIPPMEKIKLFLWIRAFIEASGGGPCRQSLVLDGYPGSKECYPHLVSIPSITRLVSW